ncbi:hypothetical protein Bbelb_137010 [Branchiostoma belcheri]|nr:hypothetical protein Bbelb_137010 [Branchiostoma belcheri]
MLMKADVAGVWCLEMAYEMPCRAGVGRVVGRVDAKEGTVVGTAVLGTPKWLCPVVGGLPVACTHSRHCPKIAAASFRGFESSRSEDGTRCGRHGDTARSSRALPSDLTSRNYRLRASQGVLKGSHAVYGVPAETADFIKAYLSVNLGQLGSECCWFVFCSGLSNCEQSGERLVATCKKAVENMREHHLSRGAEGVSLHGISGRHSLFPWNQLCLVQAKSLRSKIDIGSNVAPDAYFVASARVCARGYTTAANSLSILNVLLFINFADWPPSDVFISYRQNQENNQSAVRSALDRSLNGEKVASSFVALLISWCHLRQQSGGAQKSHVSSATIVGVLLMEP